MDKNGGILYPSLEIDLFEGVPKGFSCPSFQPTGYARLANKVEILIFLVVASTELT
jgi:hypothetical protein